MDSLLEQFYDTPFQPYDKMYDQNSDFVKYVRIRNENCEKLKAELNDRQKEYLDLCIDAASEVEDILKFDKFVYGFRIGSLLAMEIMEGKIELLK